MEIKSPSKVLAVQSSSAECKVMKRTADVAKQDARTVKMRKTADNAEKNRPELGGDALCIKTMPDSFFCMERRTYSLEESRKPFSDVLERLAYSEQASTDNKIKYAAMVKVLAEKFRKQANDVEKNAQKFNDTSYTEMMQEITKCSKNTADSMEGFAISTQASADNAIKRTANFKAMSEKFRK